MKDPVRINPVTTIAFVFFHAAAIVALFFFSWRMLLLAAGMVILSGCPGIGMGFHRLLTHRSYKTPKAVEYAATVCGCLALEGGAIWWVVWHRIHHKFTDMVGLDPHTPREGKFWSHMGWLIWNDPTLHDPGILTKYAPELCKDRFHRILNRIAWVPTVVLGLGLLWLGGLVVQMWGVFVPVVVGWHSTWLVNSATHLWGSQPFRTPGTGDSRNNWWVALITFGEGWHNNHHAFPTSARHGFKRSQIDFNWYGIKLLRFLGLASEVQTPKDILL